MIIVAALIGCAFAFDDACDKKQPPAFCQGLDCPRYKLLCCNATALIDTRAYQEALWARTEIVGGTIAQAGNTGFHRLFDYISGANSQGVAIDMTTPVTTQVFSSETPVRYIVSFFVPFLYQNATNPPPSPTDPTVYIENLPAANLAVRVFSGYSNDNEDNQMLQDLKSYLDHEGVQYNDKFYWVDGYNAPFQPVHRHNEVSLNIVGRNTGC